jgi:hypothetical protein
MAGLDDRGQGAANDRWPQDDAYWRTTHRERSYVSPDRQYDAYQPAYRYGCEASFIYGNLPWSREVELELSLGWAQARGNSDLSWEMARDAVRDGFERARAD